MTKQWTNRVEEESGRKPRLLLIDDIGITLPKLAEGLEAQGFEVMKMHVGEDAPSDDPTVIRGTFEEIFKYAVTPANRIDGVVTDLNWHGHPHGRHIVAQLVKRGFNGPIAVHSGDPDPRMDIAVKEAGAIGLFDKQEPEKIAQAINEALAQRGRTSV